MAKVNVTSTEITVVKKLHNLYQTIKTLRGK